MSSDINRIVNNAHTTTELLLRQESTPDIEEAIKLQDDIILAASQLRKEDEEFWEDDD